MPEAALMMAPRGAPRSWFRAKRAARQDRHRPHHTPDSGAAVTLFGGCVLTAHRGAWAAIATREESRMAKPMFFYTGIYDNVADADADYEAIRSLHRGKAIGSYDSAIVVHTVADGVKVTKTEKPTQKGGWIGLAAGAGVAVVFPFLLPAVSYAGMAGAGAGLGAWFGHLAHGTSRGDAKDIG